MFSKLIDLLQGKPTMDNVAHQLTVLMQEKGATDIRFDAAQGMLHYVHEGGSGMTSVASIFNELREKPKSERKAALQRYFEGVWQKADKLPNSYEEALTKLLPVVRTSTEVALNAMLVDAMNEHRPAQSKIAQIQLAEGLSVLLVIDLPSSMIQVTESQLKSWGVPFDQALADATNNLRNITDESKWTQMGDGVWFGQWDDSYESSRLLLPDLIYRLGVSDPIAMVPFRNTLFVTSAGNLQGMERVARFINENYEGSRKHLAFEVLELDGVNWHTAATQPDSLAKVRILDRHGAYSQQKTLLEQYYATRNENVFVANFNAMERDDGTVLSYVTWSKTVDALLPKADLVIFIDMEDETKRYQMSWNTAFENFTALMEPTSDIPQRWRVRSYPDDGDLQALVEKNAATHLA